MDRVEQGPAEAVHDDRCIPRDHPDEPFPSLVGILAPEGPSEEGHASCQIVLGQPRNDLRPIVAFRRTRIGRAASASCHACERTPSPAGRSAVSGFEPQVPIEELHACPGRVGIGRIHEIRKDAAHLLGGQSAAAHSHGKAGEEARRNRFRLDQADHPVERVEGVAAENQDIDGHPRVSGFEALISRMNSWDGRRSAKPRPLI